MLPYLQTLAKCPTWWTDIYARKSNQSADRGPQFASRAFFELLKLLGIISALSTAYHPQTDGTTEQTNQEIEAYLSIYCASHPEDWPQALHTLEFTHNNRRHADGPNTPFKLQPFAKRLAVPDLGDFENKQNKTNPIVGFSFFPRLSTCTISCLVNETFLYPPMNLQCVNQPVKS